MHHHQTCFCTSSRIQESFTRRDLLSCAQLCTRSLCQTSYNHNPARALRALGLLLADGASIVGWGTLFGASAVFFSYKNNHNSETKSKKIDPRATNGPLTKFGVFCQKVDFLAENLVFRPKKKPTSWYKPCSKNRCD